jgi:peptidoglycan/LPS O-acetylase OafA/YrhL
VGVYRLLLAALVVLFHFGGLSWIVGRVAVFGFYCVSGFLIFQVLDRVYADEHRGMWRFYGNRLLRLGPLYVVYVVLTLAMVRWSGSAGLSTEAGTAILENTEVGTAALLANALSFAPQVYLAGFMPVFEFSPQLIPQGWSIGVELVCYLVAPIVVVTTRRHPQRMWIWLAAGLVLFAAAVWTAGLDFDRFNSVVYKNAFASVVVFLAGGAFYYLRRRHGQPVSFSVVGVLLTVWVATLTVRAFRLGEGPSARVFTEYVWLTVALTGLVATTRIQRLRGLDTGLGNLCYGVYLNHFLVAGVLLGTGAERYLSQPGTLTFGFVVLAGSLALASLTYVVVERPFNRVRQRVRGMATPDSMQPVGHPGRARLAIAAWAIALVLLVVPAGFLSARASMGGANALASSPEFNVRWRSDLTVEERLRVENELGLDNLGQVESDPRQRTWTYRLRSPSFPGIRAVLAHSAVDDTSLDAAQLEMLRQ